MKKLFLACFILAGLQLNAGTVMDVKVQGDLRNFYLQNNMVKVITGKTTPWLLLDIGNKKIFIVQDAEKKYVEVTKAELENMVKAASSIQDVFGKGKIDFKALSSKKKQVTQVYQNPIMLDKVTSKKGIVSAGRYSIKDKAVAKGEAVFSSEIENNFGKDVNYKDLCELIINISTSKAVIDKMTEDEKLLLNVFEKGYQIGKTGVLTTIKQKDKFVYEMIKSEKKQIPDEDFLIAKSYTKKSLREFMDTK